MNVYCHELKRGWKSLLIWTVSVGGMIMLCLLIYPQMQKDVESLTQVFTNMGGITAAFGMDKLNIGELMGFYGIYAGSVMGIGGIFYAAILGTMMLAKEEKEHTAEFLLSHPAGRGRIFIAKLCSVWTQLLIFNLTVIIFSLISFGVISEEPDWHNFWLFHGAQGIMQLEISAVCFGISAFLRRGSVSVGIGFAAVLYFMGLFGNITEKAEFVKYITPYTYADAARIVENSSLDGTLIGIGLAYGLLGILAGWIWYRQKDIL